MEIREQSITTASGHDMPEVGALLRHAAMRRASRWIEPNGLMRGSVQILSNSPRSPCFIQALRYRDLERQLPDDIKIATAAPYLFTADALINKYIIIATLTAPNCKLRDKAWSQTLLAKVLRAVQQDRPDRLVYVKRTITDGSETGHRRMQRPRNESDLGRAVDVGSRADAS